MHQYQSHMELTTTSENVIYNKLQQTKIKYVRYEFLSFSEILRGMGLGLEYGV